MKTEKSWRSTCEDCGIYQRQVYRTWKNVKRPCNKIPKCPSWKVTVVRDKA